METENIINTPDFLNLINNYGNIYLDYNNHIEIINHGKLDGNTIKIITYKELLMELSSFDDNNLNYFINNGLDKNTNPKGNITLIITNNKNKTKMESYDFSYINEDKKIYYDIPYYHKHVPEGFSIFCTDEELDLVIKHVNQNDSKSKTKFKKKKENIIFEPEPSKKNFICQLCRSRFNNYKEHIISEIHLENIKKHKKSFNYLSSTFKRIINNNFNISKENSSNIKSFSNQLSDDIKDLIVFSPQNFKKYIGKQTYNLRIKNNSSFEKDDNSYLNYLISSSKNKGIKIIKNENEFETPQKQTFSISSSTIKNMISLFDEVSDTNKIIIYNKKNNKRKRDEDDNLFYDQSNQKNKRIKLYN